MLKQLNKLITSMLAHDLRQIIVLLVVICLILIILYVIKS